MRHYFKYKPRILGDGSRATNEYCDCGALKSQHLPRFAPGHGPCPGTGCPQFTWTGWKLAGLRARMPKRRK